MQSSHKYNIMRWVILLPTVIVAWYLLFSATLVGIALISENILNKIGLQTYSVISSLVVVVPIFFISYYITPKYKKITAWIIVALCEILTLSGWYGMAHMAYYKPLL